MKRMLAGLLLALGTAGAFGLETTNTITDMSFWAQELKFSLSGSAPGAFSTNGIIAHTHAVAFKITSRDIISSLSGQLAYPLDRGFFDFKYYTTNFMPGTDIITTNYVTVAYPVFGPQVTPLYSSHARLVLLQPLGLASEMADPIVAVRDGNPAVDYAVTDYLKIGNLLPAPEADQEVLTGKFDVQHDLASVTRYAITSYLYTRPGSSTNLSFNVNGYTTERIQAVTTGNEVIDSGAVKSLNASVAGAGTNFNFCVLRGTVSAQDGKLEIK